MALRQEIRELVLLLAQQAARDFLSEEAAASTPIDDNEKCPEPFGHGATGFRNEQSIRTPAATEHSAP